MLLWLLLLLQAQARAEEAEPSAALVQFFIKPKLCVLNDREAACRDTLDIAWNSAEARAPCLYQAGANTPLHCWGQGRSGELRFEWDAKETTIFQLRERGSNLALGDQQYQVIRNEKKYRRTRRNPWSFF